MKVSELMDNDLLMYGGHLCRFVIRSMDAIVQRLSDMNEYPPCAVSNAEPIHLTKEMLVNDEFYIAEEASHNAVLKKKTDDALIVVLLIGNSFVLNIERNIEFEGTYAIDSVHKCGYFVHEYQHALRLCGLNDLADNFKVNINN